ncbi:MAG: sodium:solute symporter family protein [Bdellovibrionota bacterium]
MIVNLRWIDYAIMLVYFCFVFGIGYSLKKYMKTSSDFFLSGRSIPVWVTSLAFISANLGAQEVIGMGASGAKYGIATAHFYWIAAIPAMLFVGIFMMPFYYGSKVRSVPEYLRMRFDEKTRGLNAITFSIMTLFSSGISMYVMGKLFNLLLGWNFDLCILIAAGIVLGYTFFGGLTSAIYNEVLQFFLIVLSFVPVVVLGLVRVGGWSGLVDKLNAVAVQDGLQSGAYTHVWKYMDNSANNPIGVEWIGLAMGLGFVLAFGYWCTDFLVVQRAMAADSMSAARRTPIIAAIPKMFFPILVILPGMIALVTTSNLPNSIQGIIPAVINPTTNSALLNSNGKIVLDYDLSVPLMLVNYLPSGLLGLGLTALLASFMSGMSGNVTAFNTVWTYDIYQSYINKNASDKHYLWMGRFATVFGVILSVGCAYIAASFNNIMDMLQLCFAFVNAPLFATFALGMFWKRSTGHAAFFGLLIGTLAAVVHHGLTLPTGSHAGIKGGYFAVLHIYRSELGQTFYTAISAFSSCFMATVIISLFTKATPKEKLVGLVYSLTEKSREPVGTPWYKQPVALGAVVLVSCVILNIIFF